MNEGSKEFAEYFNKLLEEKEPRALQVSVAEKLGVSQGTLSKLRRGAMIPSDDLARKIAEVWDLDMDSMMESIGSFETTH